MTAHVRFSDENAPLMGATGSKIRICQDQKQSSQSHSKIYDEIQKGLVILIFSGFGVLAREALSFLSSQSMMTFQSRNSAFETSNMIGTFIIGFLSLVPENIGHHLHVGLTVGFCGTLTTFTSFIWESISDDKPPTKTIDVNGETITVPVQDQMRRAGSVGLVLTNITSTMALCIVSWLVGRWIAETLHHLRVHKHLVSNPASLLDDVLIDDEVEDDDDDIAVKKAAAKAKAEGKKPLLRGYLSHVLFSLSLAGWLVCFVCTLVWPNWQIYDHVKFPPLPKDATQAEKDEVQNDHESATKYTYTLLLCFAFLGAYLRYILSLWLNPKRNGFFTGTFVCNMLAIVIICSFYVQDDVNRWGRYDCRPFRVAVEVGFCGALSTVSSFINDLFKGFKRSKDHAIEAQEKQDQTVIKSKLHKDYAAGYWAAFSPIVYCIATLACGVGIASIYHFGFGVHHKV